jgi:glucosamine 6-phosphate synthetase-like amidotransferase/phosphosugar isomerase protein
MCGIAGFCINDEDHKKLKTRRIAKSLLLAIQERGEDATGAAWSESDNGKATVFYAKSDIPAHEFVESLDDMMPFYTRTAILHTRWATKGDPANNDNNHPIVVGNTVGIHNGVITNDDELFESHKWIRQGDVDSEAIFQLIEHAKDPLPVLNKLEGRAAIAWLDTDEPNTLHLARLDGSPLVVGYTNNGSVFFASTLPLLRQAAADAFLRLVKVEEIKPWTYIKVVKGVVLSRRNLKPAEPLPLIGHDARFAAFRQAKQPTLADMAGNEFMWK